MSVVNCQSISVGPGLRRRSAPRNAFTLVELLIVTSIVVILIGVLIPTLNRSIRAAKATVCMANLKDLFRSLDMYRTDNGGWLPTVEGDAVNRSTAAWSATLFKDNPSGRGVLICPEDPWGEILRNSYAHGSGNEDFPSSYGMNDFIVSSPSSFLANVGRISPKRPDSTILVADMGPDEVSYAGELAGGSPAPSRNFGRLSIDDGYQIGQPPGYQFSPWLSGRHSNKINVLTLNGNVKPINVKPVLQRDIEPYYSACASQDCTVCIYLELPHYSFHESGTFWWTGPVPIR
ncbi:MAG: type II secretion system protein [Phycisphaerales bacterium]|nr:type II secretion system protein [Phycisphaerales bacterium]